MSQEVSEMQMRIKLGAQRAKRGQITLEYIVIFVVVAGATLLTMTNWDNTVRASLEGLFLNMVGKLQ